MTAFLSVLLFAVVVLLVLVHFRDIKNTHTPDGG